MGQTDERERERFGNKELKRSMNREATLSQTGNLHSGLQSSPVRQTSRTCASASHLFSLPNSLSPSGHLFLFLCHVLKKISFTSLENHNSNTQKEQVRNWSGIGGHFFVIFGGILRPWLPCGFFLLLFGLTSMSHSLTASPKRDAPRVLGWA